MRKLLLNRPPNWMGIALGGAVMAIGVLVWPPQSLEGDAGANVSDALRSPTEASDRSTSTAQKSNRAPTDEARDDVTPGFFFRDYFERNYYAYYFDGSPVRDVDWVPGPQPAASPFALTSIGNVWELDRFPSSTLSVPVPRELPDVSKLVPLPTATVPGPSFPKGLLTNETPFHLFVTSESISPSSAGTFGSSTLAPASAAVPSASSLTGATLGTATPLLRR